MAVDIAISGVVVAGLLLAILLVSARSIYRLFLHPLADVPGPRLAALTSLHEFWYDCLKNRGGQHAFKLREMHDRYGRYLLLASRLLWGGLTRAQVPSSVSTLGKFT